MKAVVAAFNQEKALVGAFSVITNLRMELFGALLSSPPRNLTLAPSSSHSPRELNSAFNNMRRESLSNQQPAVWNKTWQKCECCVYLCIPCLFWRPGAGFVLLSSTFYFRWRGSGCPPGATTTSQPPLALSHSSPSLGYSQTRINAMIIVQVP